MHSAIFCSDWLFDPPSWEAVFCVVGGDSKTRRLAEEDAQRLVSATDAYASMSRHTYEPQRHPDGVTPIVPVIVTTAKMYVTRYGTSAVSLGNGEFNDASAVTTEPVTIVRFRKPFVTHTNRDLGDRTVLVVAAEAFDDFLESVSVQHGGYQPAKREYGGIS